MYNTLWPVGIVPVHEVFCARCSIKMYPMKDSLYRCPQCGEEAMSEDNRQIGQEEYVK